MKIEKITPKIFKQNKFNKKNTDITFLKSDKLLSEGLYINFYSEAFKKDINFLPLIERNIANKNENSEAFFNRIASYFFNKPEDKTIFLNYLKNGYISFSTSAYKGITTSKKPFSAIGIELDCNKTIVEHLANLEEIIKNEQGAGINFSKFENPTDTIKQINSYFLFRQKENDLKRPPAGIALLNIDNPEILEFIKLKDEENYSTWCFDLSVILPDDFIQKVDNNETITLTNGKKIAAKEIYNTLLNSMLKKGEPGVIFSNDKNYICDSCAAAPLKPNEGLTLAHINLAKFYDKNKNSIDTAELNNAARYLSIALSKLDNNGYIGILGYQELLDKMNLQYGKNEANKILDLMLKTIKEQTSKFNLKMSIAPTGTISRILKTTPAIEPNKNRLVSYDDELNTMKTAQKYLEGNISKTIQLNKDATPKDIDYILRKAQEYKLRGLTVFKAQ